MFRFEESKKKRVDPYENAYTLWNGMKCKHENAKRWMAKKISNTSLKDGDHDDDNRINLVTDRTYGLGLDLHVTKRSHIFIMVTIMAIGFCISTLISIHFFFLHANNDGNFCKTNDKKKLLHFVYGIKSK